MSALVKAGHQHMSSAERSILRIRLDDELVVMSYLTAHLHVCFAERQGKRSTSAKFGGHRNLSLKLLHQAVNLR